MIGTKDLSVATENLLVATGDYSLAKALGSLVAYSSLGSSWVRKRADLCRELCMVWHSLRCVELFLEAWKVDWPCCVVLVAVQVGTLCQSSYDAVANWAIFVVHVPG